VALRHLEGDIEAERCFSSGNHQVQR